jgi:predicted DsbA family dithiol-disulfide isomerase
VAGEAGLDVAAAREVLESKAYADEVRQLEYYWQRAGIRSVPAIVINQRHLISGGQPPEVFEQPCGRLRSRMRSWSRMRSRRRNR